MDFHCPSCKSNKVVHIGEIPSTNRFAGRVLGRLLPGGSLYRCDSCHLYFRWPRLPKEQRGSMYQRASTGHWQYHAENRRDWQIAAEFLHARLVYRTILDIGCWDGGFLRYLGTGWQRYGVEISNLAAQHAEEHGIRILAKKLIEIEHLSMQFGVVTAMDIVEHVDDPRHLVTQMERLTHPGGFLVISTGDTNSPSWRFMGSRYWYCTIAEHVSFINEQWCYDTAKALNLYVEHIERFCHAGRNRNLLQMILDLTKNTFYKLAPSAMGKLRAIGFGGINVREHEALKQHPPSWMSARDHSIVFFRKQ